MNSPLQTRLTDLFGIDRPIFAGGMMWLSDGRFVAAVSRAGGMGFLTPRSFPERDELERELRLCAELADGRPFGVNLTISDHVASNARLAEHLAIALAHGVRHFETAGYLRQDLVDAIHAGDGIVLHKVSRVRHALAAQRAGVDAICLVGMEEGGHPGVNELTTFVMGAAAAPKLTIPWALGGGIGTGAQLVAALALGAGGVVMGSRFLTSDEIWAHEDYKRYVVGLDHDCSTTALRSIGSTWRVLRNDTVAEVQRMEAAGRTSFGEMGPLIRGTIARDHCYRQGDWTVGMISIGSAAGFADRLQPVRSTVDQIMAEAQVALRSLGCVA